MEDRSGALTWRGEVLGVWVGNSSCSTPASIGIKVCRHWGWEWETVTALEADEANCETQKCCQPQTFARNTFIQLLRDCSEALTHNTCTALHLVL